MTIAWSVACLVRWRTAIMDMAAARDAWKARGSGWRRAAERGRCGSGAGGCRRSLRVAAAARGLLRWVQRVAAGGEGGLGCREGLDASSRAAGCRTIGSIPFAA